jgi:hypothetical protein
MKRKGGVVCGFLRINACANTRNATRATRATHATRATQHPRHPTRRYLPRRFAG